MKAIQKVKGKRLKILQQKEITEQVLHVSKAFSSKCGSETKKGVMKVILVMLWSLKKKMIGCGAWECSSTACVDAVFSKESNSVETEVESLSTILILMLGEVHVVGIGYCRKYDKH